MNSESTDQVQGQESASIQDITTIQNQLPDTSNIQLQNSVVDEITQNCTSNEVEILTSSIQISDSTATQASYEANKSLIGNLYKILICEKLPTTDESSSLSMVTNKLFSAADIKENEAFEEEIEAFTEILEILSEVCSDCESKIEEMTKNVRLRIEKIKTDKWRLTILIKENKLDAIVQKYEKLKADEVLMKVLFHKHYSIGNSNQEIFKKLKNYQSINQKFILKDLCDTFERIVIPKTQALLSSIESENNLTWNTLDNSIKSTILKSYVDFQGFYFPLQELIQNNSEHLNSLSHQQIVDIIQHGFTKVSKIEQLSIPFYIKKTFIWEHMKAYEDDYPLIERYLHYAETKKQREFIVDHTKTYNNLKEELKIRKILILTDELGSGKTTTMKYFARRFKEDDKHLWVSYIDAKLSAKAFQKIEQIQNFNNDEIAAYLVEILELSGLEVSIFKQKFMNNKVILLWDHIDHKFQQTLLNFTWNVKQLTENQQVFATHLRYSEILAQKFDRTAYKFIPFTTFQIEKFHRRLEDFMDFNVGYWKFFAFCDTIGLGNGHYNYNREIFINNNILMLKLILLAIVDLKKDLNYEMDFYLLLERVFKKQLMERPHKLTDDDEIILQKFLQSHALKKVFGDELTKSLKVVKNYSNILPPISTLVGIFNQNFDDNSVIFQHKIIEEYFIMMFMTDNVMYGDIKDISVKEAQKLVTILAMIITQDKFRYLLKFIKDTFKFHSNPTYKDHIYRIIKKAKYWPKVTKLYGAREIKHIVHVNNYKSIFDDIEFWTKLLKEIQAEKDKNVAKEKVKRDVQQTELEVKRNDKELKDKPSIKGVTSMKKLNQNSEICHQLNEFLEDFEADESD